jgi:hypothetical protein
VRLIHILRSPALALGLLSASMPSATGCAPTTTRIAQGQPFTTGTAAYDDFFKAVRELHAEAQRADADERASHAPLIAAMGLEPKTPMLMAMNEAGQRAKKIREWGVLLHLEILPMTRVVTKKETRDGGLSPEGKDFIKAVEDATKRSIALSRRVGAIAGRAAELERVRADLRAQAPSTFRNEREAQRDETIQELDAAKDVLAETAELSNRYAGFAAKFVLDLAYVLETNEDAYAEGQPPAETGKAPQKSTSQPPSSPPPATPDTQPAAKRPPAATPAQRPPPARKPPAQKPGGSDDFEP